MIQINFTSNFMEVTFSFNYSQEILPIFPQFFQTGLAIAYSVIVRLLYKPVISCLNRLS